MMAIAAWFPASVRAQAAACSATETLQTFDFTALSATGGWPNGNLGPRTVTVGAVPNAINLTFTSTPVSTTSPISGGSPTRYDTGGMPNTLFHWHGSGSAAGSLLSIFNMATDRPINKLTWIAADVDGASYFQDEIRSRVNGTVLPTSLVGGAMHSINLATGTATASTSTDCSDSSAACNVTNNFNVIGIRTASMEFRTGPSLATNGPQYIGWNRFSWCLPQQPSLDKAFSGALLSGGSVDLVFTITQPVGSPMQTFSFKDTLPTGLRVGTGPTTATSTCTAGTLTAAAGASTITVTNYQIAAGATSCTIVVPITTAAIPRLKIATCPETANTNGNSSISDTSFLTVNIANSAAGGGTSTTGACVTVVTGQPNLVLTKSHAGGTLVVGSNVTYSLVAANTGTLATTTDVTVTDTLPPGLTLISASGAGWTCAAGPPITCTRSAAIAAGAAAPAITIVASVGLAAVPQVNNTARVSGGGEPATLAGDNAASDLAAVEYPKTNAFAPDNAQTVLPGATVVYSHFYYSIAAGTVQFTLANTATPANPAWTQTLFHDANCNGVLDGAEATAALTAPLAVAANSAVCIIVRDHVPSSTAFGAQNAIVVSAVMGASVLTVNDVTTVGTSGNAGLAVVKTVRNVTLGTTASVFNQSRPGDELSYVVTYTNQSPGGISNIVINDVTPSFTTHLSAACGPLPLSITSCVIVQPASGAKGAYQWTLGGTLAAGASGSVSFNVRVNP